MSRSDYKNIYEGYLDNTGYKGGVHYRERYRGCGSEPTPYMMNENQITEEYSSLPDCGKLGSVITPWTTCESRENEYIAGSSINQTATYSFSFNKKPYSYTEGKDKDGQTIKKAETTKTRAECEEFCNTVNGCNGIVTYTKDKNTKGECWAVKSVDNPYTRNGSAVAKTTSYTRDDVKNKVCKLPLPLNNSNITADFVNGRDNTKVEFDNACTLKNPWPGTEKSECDPKSDYAVGLKTTTYNPTKDERGKVTFKNPRTVEDTTCRIPNKTKWVKDYFGTICPLTDYTHTNYYQCLKEHGGNDDAEIDGKSRERCCKSNITSSGYCNFGWSPCKPGQPWHRAIGYNRAADDLGGVKYGYKGMDPKDTGESCTSDHECKYGCKGTGKCG